MAIDRPIIRTALPGILCLGIIVVIWFCSCTVADSPDNQSPAEPSQVAPETIPEPISPALPEGATQDIQLLYQRMTALNVSYPDRKQAAISLSALDRDGLAALTLGLWSNAVSTRRLATQGLTRIATGPALDALAKRLVVEPKAGIKREILNALDELGSDRYAQTLTETMLHDPLPQMRHGAYRTMLKLNTLRTRSTLARVQAGSTLLLQADFLSGPSQFGISSVTTDMLSTMRISLINEQRSPVFIDWSGFVLFIIRNNPATTIDLETLPADESDQDNHQRVKVDSIELHWPRKSHAIRPQDSAFCHVDLTVASGRAPGAWDLVIGDRTIALAGSGLYTLRAAYLPYHLDDSEGRPEALLFVASEPVSFYAHLPQTP